MKLIKEPLVWIVIPTRNRSYDLIECIQSIEKQTYKNYKILIIDNNSEDDTLEKLHIIFPFLEIIHLEKNFGASYASNRGFDFVLKKEAEYVLRLDSDTILDPDYLSKLMKGMMEIPDAGIVSGTIYYFFQPETIWFTGGNITKWDLNMRFLEKITNNFSSNQPNYEVDLVPSTGMLISREVIENLNGFDEDYLVYYEDFDFCLKTKKLGKKIYYLPGAKLWHKIFSNKKNAWTAFNWNRSKMIYYRKHAFSNIHLGFLVVYAITYALFRACFPKDDRGNRGPLIHTLKGFWSGLFAKLDSSHE